VAPFVVLGQVGFVLTERRAYPGSVGRLAVCEALALLVCLPIPVQYLAWYAKAPGIDRATSLAALPYTFFTYSVGFSLGPSVRALHDFSVVDDIVPHLGVLLSVGLLFGVLIVTGGIALSREQSVAPVLWLLSAPILCVFGLSFFSKYAFNVRYTIPALAPYLVLLALAFRTLRWPSSAWLGVALALVWSMSLYNHYVSDEYAKDDYLGSLRFVKERCGRQDPIVSVYSPSLVGYYGALEGIESAVLASTTPNLSEQIKTYRAQCTAEASRLWLIVTRAYDYDRSQKVSHAVNQEFRQVGDARRFAGSAVYLFAPRDNSAADANSYVEVELDRQAALSWVDGLKRNLEPAPLGLTALVTACIGCFVVSGKRHLWGGTRFRAKG
jgi:hypothetical protein